MCIRFNNDVVIITTKEIDLKTSPTSSSSWLQYEAFRTTGSHEKVSTFMLNALVKLLILIFEMQILFFQTHHVS